MAHTPIGGFRKNLKVFWYSTHPYKDFSKKNKVSIQDPHPYNDIFEKTENPEYRAHTQGKRLKNQRP